jgi:DNA primase
VALFPQSFIDEVRMQADIVQVVQDTVPLKKLGATYKGLCPFHAEKTPSFHVNRERGFFHCFGCGVGGDVFKFVELRDRVGFGEAVRHLAGRFGIPVPKLQDGPRDEAVEAEREALLKMHEVA